MDAHLPVHHFRSLRYASCAFVLVMVGATSIAQVTVDRPIILNGTSNEARQVTGLAPDTDPGAALNTSTERSGLHRYSLPTPSTTWSIDLASLPDAVAGTQLNLVVPDGEDAAVLVSVNGAEALPLEWMSGLPVLGSELQAGGTISVVHSGTSYQMLSGASRRIRNCPVDMIAVNTQFCVDTAESAATDFVQASLACAALGKRMCSWAEHHAACADRIVLGLSAMNDGWEWTNNTSNEDNSVRMVGYSTCTNAGNRLMTGPAAAYHCCFTR